jgi:hypothetical protein
MKIFGTSHQWRPKWRSTWRPVGLVLLGSMAMGLTATSTWAVDESNFGVFKLNPQTKASMVNGSTGGSTSLPAIVANSDRNDNQCFGFGDPKPDHIMQLNRKADRLKFQVDSGGKDTTLVIVGPDGTVRCADDFGSGKDAGLEDSDWQPGDYKIWIGSVAPSARYKYRLLVEGS